MEPDEQKPDEEEATQPVPELDPYDEEELDELFDELEGSSRGAQQPLLRTAAWVPRGGFVTHAQQEAPTWRRISMVR